jgi:ABC-2 type transport system ATP-binding protein
MSLPIVDITGLTKTYGKARGIENVNLQINEGEIFGFIGPNGAGKSTTIRILLNLIFPSSGSAHILGMDVVKDTKKIKQHIGYIPSDANAYTFMDVLTFLNYCLRYYQIENGEQRIQELANWFELDLKRKIADLSLGNRKKVAIVQSLLHSPKLLILDEPTTGLDPLMQAKFFELLRLENQRGMTIFFSSHLLNEVQLLCKRVAIIKEGKIVQVEEIDTLRKKQLKRINIALNHSSTDFEIIDLAGLEGNAERIDNKISFMFSGDMNALVAFLANKKLENLTIEEPTLEEIFMHYYH